MEKIHIYFVPGMAASTKIYEYLQLDPKKHITHYISWKLPLSKNESIESYAKRMCEEIKHQNPVLVGVSFGGVIVQEMSKIIATKKVIIISSIKNINELPKRFKLAKETKLYKLFPAKLIEKLGNRITYFVINQQKAEAYNKYLSVRNAAYLDWSIYTLLHWKQDKSLENIIHIHGNKDEIFPIKYIKNAIVINNGLHGMILTKAKKISLLIEKNCD